MLPHNGNCFFVNCFGTWYIRCLFSKVKCVFPFCSLSATWAVCTRALFTLLKIASLTLSSQTIGNASSSIRAHCKPYFGGAFKSRATQLWLQVPFLFQMEKCIVILGLWLQATISLETLSTRAKIWILWGEHQWFYFSHKKLPFFWLEK